MPIYGVLSSGDIIGDLLLRSCFLESEGKVVGSALAALARLVNRCGSTRLLYSIGLYFNFRALIFLLA